MEKTFKQSIQNRTGRIPEICGKLMDAINLTLNQDWFYKLSENLPINMRDLADIMEFLSIDACFFAGSSYPDLKQLREGCEALKNFISNIKLFLLPVIREKLGISCLDGHNLDRGSREFICNSFIAYAFPVNLQRLESCLEALHRELELIVVPRGVHYAKQLHQDLM